MCCASFVDLCLISSKKLLAILSSNTAALFYSSGIPSHHLLDLLILSAVSYPLISISLFLFCLHSGYFLGPNFWFTNELCLIWYFGHPLNFLISTIKFLILNIPGSCIHSPPNLWIAFLVFGICLLL